MVKIAASLNYPYINDVNTLDNDVVRARNDCLFTRRFLTVSRQEIANGRARGRHLALCALTACNRSTRSRVSNVRSDARRFNRAALESLSVCTGRTRTDPVIGGEMMRTGRNPAGEDGG